MSEIQSIKITDHHLGCITTNSRKIIDLRHPRPEDIDIKDIAAGLSKICRFGGQCQEFYSVAQHSVLVAHLASPPLSAVGLLHDAAEAYLGDVVKPLKVILGDCYSDLEHAFERAIFRNFGLQPDLKQNIKEMDVWALHIENEAFRHGNPGHLLNLLRFYDIPHNRVAPAWSPSEGEAHFLHYANLLIL